MIYLDNAATGGFKPRTVTETAESIIRFLSANPGRSGHRLSLTGAEIIYDCRKLLAEVFGGTSDRVVFTKNCTEALNLAIFGTVKKGGHVITTIFEHNSVLRPLYHLKDKGIISLDVVSPTTGRSIVDEIKDKINDKTYLVITTSVSNVTGEELPVGKIGALCKSRNLLYLVDGAQGGGHVKLNLDSDNISMLALAGHKGLYGIMGSGALIFNKDVEISPIIFGGTGTESLSTVQPLAYPERLESGTLSLPNIASLLEGVRYMKNNFEHFSKHLFTQTATLISALTEVKGLTLYSNPNHSGIVSFRLDNMPSSEVADRLNSDYDVAVRGGLHCAPLIHKFLGTEKEGLTRVSLAVQNSTRELYYLVKAVKELAKI